MNVKAIILHLKLEIFPKPFQKTITRINVTQLRVMYE